MHILATGTIDASEDYTGGDWLQLSGTDEFYTNTTKDRLVYVFVFFANGTASETATFTPYLADTDGNAITTDMTGNAKAFTTVGAGDRFLLGPYPMNTSDWSVLKISLTYTTDTTVSPTCLVCCENTEQSIDITKIGGVTPVTLDTAIAAYNTPRTVGHSLRTAASKR